MATPLSPTSGEQRRSSTRVRWFLWIPVITIAVAFVAGLAVRWLPLDSLIGGEWNAAFYSDLEKLNAGQTDGLYLYSTTGTDSLTKQIQGMAGVKDLVLELTDVTDAGMQHVATLPNLRSLTLIGGRPGVGNDGLSRLRTCSHVKRLELINTKVTDEGLAILKELPNLRSVTLYRDGFRDATFTDAGLLHLKALPNLRSIDLTGGWITDAGLAHLHDQGALKSLSLDGSKNVTDAGLTHLTGLTTLENLLLRNTAISDAGLAHLSSLMNLKELALSSTRVTDAGLTHLRGLPDLKGLYLANTQTTDAGIAELQQALPELKVYR